MFSRLLFGMVVLTLFCSPAFAEDFWDTVFDEMYGENKTADNEHEQSDGLNFLIPLHSLSLETHGDYFGSGNEFLLGGAHVSGLGGARHNNDHSINHPTYNVYPEVQHLFSGEIGMMGPMWGTPDGFAPTYSEVDREHAKADDRSSHEEYQGTIGSIDDDDWWDD